MFPGFLTPRLDELSGGSRARRPFWPDCHQSTLTTVNRWTRQYGRPHLSVVIGVVVSLVPSWLSPPVMLRDVFAAGFLKKTSVGSLRLTGFIRPWLSAFPPAPRLNENSDKTTKQRLISRSKYLLIVQVDGAQRQHQTSAAALRTRGSSPPTFTLLLPHACAGTQQRQKSNRHINNSISLVQVGEGGSGSFLPLPRVYYQGHRESLLTFSTTR